MKEAKYMGGQVIDTKEEDRNGIPVGVVEGYIATWDLDEGLDRFHKGAFLKSLVEHKTRGGRPIRLKDHHGRTVGAFPLDGVVEDEKGLFGRGEINLVGEQGQFLFSLVKQGALSDFSIGFSTVDSEFNSETLIRDIFEAKVWEGSVVDEPMNRAAQITDVKSAAFGDLDLAPSDTPWNVAEAFERVSKHPNRKQAFLVDGESPRPSDFLVGDVIEGDLMIVPQAIIEASKTIGDQPELQAHLERYFLKMRVKSPFESPEYHGIDEVKEWTPRQMERALNKSGRFSKSASKILSGRLDGKLVMGNTPDYNQEVMAKIQEDLKALIKGD
jgi:HK97 family phage prohead protease